MIEHVPLINLPKTLEVLVKFSSVLTISRNVDVCHQHDRLSFSVVCIVQPRIVEHCLYAATKAIGMDMLSVPNSLAI